MQPIRPKTKLLLLPALVREQRARARVRGGHLLLSACRRWEATAGKEMSQRLKRGSTYINQMKNKGHHRSGRQSLSLCRLRNASFPDTKSQIMHAIWCASFIFIREINTYFTFEFVSDFIILYSTAAPPVGKPGKFKTESVPFWWPVWFGPVILKMRHTWVG